MSPSKTLPKSELDRAVISVMKVASVSFEVLLTASGINLSGVRGRIGGWAVRVS